MTSSLEHDLQNALNELYAWIVIQKENLKIHSDINIEGLPRHLSRIENLIQGRTLKPEMFAELNKMQLALQQLGEGLSLKQQEIAGGLKQMNQQAQGISRYIQATNWEKK